MRSLRTNRTNYNRIAQTQKAFRDIASKIATEILRVKLMNNVPNTSAVYRVELQQSHANVEFSNGTLIKVPVDFMFNKTVYQRWLQNQRGAVLYGECVTKHA